MQVDIYLFTCLISIIPMFMLIDVLIIIIHIFILTL